MLAALLLLPFGGEAKASNILDLYRELQRLLPAGFPTYTIDSSKRPPSASGGALYGARARVSLVMDAANGYLRITDRGDGDEASGFVTELAVWTGPKGQPLVGLSEWGVKSGAPFAGRVRFYARAGGTWRLVTGRVWPELDRDLCQTEPQEVVEDTSAWEGLGRAITLLPRKGRTAEVWCVPPSPVAGQGMALEFDPAIGAFRKGPALAGPPQWPGGVAPP
ncbi:hypothetical protein V5F59_07860 [Xanthobacter autotrophicus DSM 431]|uniref:hypothetical protein n=1 Tax=Xanthobacter nonsaccharivorans TaxID=3119912 RepID=UPI003726CC12